MLSNFFGESGQSCFRIASFGVWLNVFGGKYAVLTVLTSITGGNVINLFGGIWAILF